MSDYKRQRTHIETSNDRKHPFVGDIDFNKLIFSPLAVKGPSNKQEVILSMEEKKRLWMHLCPDIDDPMFAKFSIDSANDENPDRRGQTLVVDHPQTLQSLKTLDDKIIQMAVERSKEWFKKTLDETQVRSKYVPLLKRRDGESIDFVKIKLKCGNADYPTKLHLMQNNRLDPTKPFDMVPNGATLQHLEARSCKLVPLVSIYALWFGMGGAFGLSMQAETICVYPGESSSIGSEFLSKRPIAIMERDDVKRMKCDDEPYVPLDEDAM